MYKMTPIILASAIAAVLTVAVVPHYAFADLISGNNGNGGIGGAGGAGGTAGNGGSNSVSHAGGHNDQDANGGSANGGRGGSANGGSNNGDNNACIRAGCR